MRIWLLSSEIPHEFAGGIARYIDTFARVVADAGHEVTIVARVREQCDVEYAPGIRLYGFATRDRFLGAADAGDEPASNPAYPYNVMSYWPALSYQLADEVLALAQREGPPDVVECQEYGGLLYYLLQRKLTEDTPLAHVPILVHLHSATFDLLRLNHEPRYRFPLYWVGRMERFCIVAADAVLSPSRFLAESVRQTLGRSLDIDVIPYPYAPASAATLEAPLALRPHRGELVYVGRLELRKGVLPLLDTCARMWEAGEDFALTLIGGDTDYPARGTTVGEYIRRRHARWLDAGRLRLTGNLPHTEVLAALERAWAVLVPSIWENFPNVCIESLAAGRVVIASRAGGQAEMIGDDGVAGLLFSWDEPSSLEAALRRALAFDEAAWQRMSAAARSRIRALCDPQTLLARRMEHFAKLLAQPQRRAHFPTVTPPLADPTRWVGAGEGETPGLLSVIIPFFNLGATLPETLASVRASIYEPYEIVIVDDGSTDHASLVLLKLVADMPNVRVVRTDNQGLASARNAGACHARGEFLAFLDADDMISPEYYARSIEVLRRYDNVTFVYAWSRFFEGGTGVWPTFNTEFPYLLGHNMLAAFAVVRRRAFLEAGLNKRQLAYSLEDFESWLSMVAAGAVGVSLPEPLVHYRVRANSMLRQSHAQQQMYLYEQITEQHPQLYQQWGEELFHLLNANGPAFLWNNPAIDPPLLTSDEAARAVLERDQLLADKHLLMRGWADHVAYIEGQQAYIAQLEERAHKLATQGLRGALARRARMTWLGNQLERNPRLSLVIRRLLRI